ncbi:MAG: hypothetical protein IJM64_08650 [Ottowia sp.]|nr:hypothetical protein [Ottowia sp.]
MYLIALFLAVPNLFYAIGGSLAFSLTYALARTQRNNTSRACPTVCLTIARHALIHEERA